MKFDVFTVVKIWIVTFWVMTSCSLVGNLKMEAIRSSETIAITYKTRSRNPESHFPQLTEQLH
jgi:hypothetical protein